ncbi:MAG: GNAT family N-acetyltransferase [Pseudomonadota bacterium]
MTAHILDRPVWNALTSRQAHLAAGDPATALRFVPQINVFGGTPDNTPGQLMALGTLTPRDGGVAIVERHRVVPPPDLIAMIEEPVHQMTAARITDPGDEDPDIVPLGDADAAEMQALAELTQPGPFYARTHEMGEFVGIRENGRLIAMTGERMRVPGFTEISAVCTHPGARGRGLAAKLMRIVAARIVARGEQLFLHVYPHNKAAIAVYERLGFRHRADMRLTVLRHRQPGES